MREKVKYFDIPFVLYAVYNDRMNDVIAEKLKMLPDLPGVYKMYNARGEVIYVGKAVNLKNRVRQYFHSQNGMQPKVIAMVANIADFEYILTANETEALTLEASLIKSMQPRYNILLKDDKHFPYVRMDPRQDFPRFEVVRRVANDGATYFGPYLSGIALREALEHIRDSFPVRHCKKDIKKAIARGERPCLMYHLGKCCAPCSGNVTRADYHALMERVGDFLNGNIAPIVDALEKDMLIAAENMEFERAAMLRDRIHSIKMLNAKQRAMLANDAERDVFALVRDDVDALVYALFVRNGSVIGSQHMRIECADETPGEIMEAFIKQFYAESGSIPREIAVLDMPDDAHEIEEWLRSIRKRAVAIVKPRRGEKLKQVMMAQRNGVEAIVKQRQLEHRAWEKGEGAIARLSAIIGLESIPERMECYDNSHMQGRDTVAGMVVFEHGKPAPKEYRRFRIKAETGGDDYLAMREVLTRRFERAKQHDEKFARMPDLIVVDGGRGQLNVALEVMREYGVEYIPVIGLAERNEEIILPDVDEAIVLEKRDSALHMLQRIRDEAHRFALSYHRSLRSKTALYSELDEIEGVGPKRKRLLFEAFVTRDAIARASINELNAVSGITHATAEAVYRHFHKDEDNIEADGGESKA